MISGTVSRGFGPIRAALAGLDATGRDQLRADVAAYHAHYTTDAGLHIRREYLTVIGRRK